ncbi:hypothetical protein JB92DRAFT_2831729 [Gautieria morchelliformis]|nr:hypothetical protein JB92DRAFT_2831729 [Gautieria morchelliformis]
MPHRESLTQTRPHVERVPRAVAAEVHDIHECAGVLDAAQERVPQPDVLRGLRDEPGVVCDGEAEDLLLGRKCSSAPVARFSRAFFDTGTQPLARTRALYHGLLNNAPAAIKVAALEHAHSAHLRVERRERIRGDLGAAVCERVEQRVRAFWMARILKRNGRFPVLASGKQPAIADPTSSACAASVGISMSFTDTRPHTPTDVATLPIQTPLPLLSSVVHTHPNV